VIGYYEAIKLLVSMLILGCSCVTDWKSRRAPNELWFVMGGAGLLLDLYAFWQGGFDASYAIRSIASVLFIFALVYLIFSMGGFGGADAKALIAIAIMFPLYPSLELAGNDFPAAGSLMSPIFALSVLGNAIVLTAALPPCTLAYNLLTVPAGEIISNPIGAITGYRTSIDRLIGKHLRLMHRYDEAGDRIEKRLSLKGQELDDDMLARLIKWQSEGKIDDHVWVTPKLPFLIQITLGFFAGIFYGDILMQMVSILLCL
jgi:preflagellin peptidase FlaK